MKNSFKPEEEDNKEIINDGQESGVDTLSIHCIIQTVSCLEDIKSGECQCCDEKGKMTGRNWWDCDCNDVEMSGCVVVPEDTCIDDFVETVLLKLGYPIVTASYASGSILIRNWKPLPLKSICPAMNKTVGDILGELTAVVSLRIKIFRPQMTKLDGIKDNLLNYLVRANQSFLNESGCPFDVGTLLKFCNSTNRIKKQLFHDPSEEIREKFDAWLKHIQEAGKELGRVPKIQLQSTSFANENTHLDKNGVKERSPNPNVNFNNGYEDSMQQHEHSQEQEQCPNSTKLETCKTYPSEFGKEKSGTLVKEASRSFSAMERPKHSVVPKTRIRTSFDPEMELPKLHKWYLENPHPSRQQIYEYVTELNSLESRKDRKQLDVNNVLYWFKNARAAQKRTECRKATSLTPGTPTGVVNRGNVLKIPLGKTSGVTSDDQRSLSDDEGSVTPESPEDYRTRSDRCLQVVGKWNSNGQGEAVLEMQIGSSHKTEFVPSTTTTFKRDQKNEDEEEEDNMRNSNLSTDEDSVDPGQRLLPLDKKKNIENDVKDKDDVDLDKGNKERNAVDKPKSAKSRQSNADEKKDEVSSSKTQLRTRFPMYKEDSVGNESTFMTPYNSGITNLFEHSLMCMSQYINSKPNHLPLSADERRKRNRTFIDPVTEVPRLEEWFRLSTHPSHNLIARYTDELNNMPYRRKFPKLETKNVQFWFKNRRAKNKRLNYLEINK